MYQTYTPAPPLSSFVDYFWQTDEAGQPFARERALPMGSVQLSIHLDGDEQRVTTREAQAPEQVFRDALLRGPGAQWYVVQPGRSTSRVGVQFAPGGAYPFFAPPASALREIQAPLDAVWGARAREICDRLRDAPTPRARFLLLERLLLAHAVRPLELHPAVEYALKRIRVGASVRSIAQLVDEAGVSHHRFIDLFRAQVGLTPKEHCRLRRFLWTARYTQGCASVSWADLAVQMGYCDQAHLIHDFQAFCGLSPSAYLRLRHPQFWSYVPLAETSQRQDEAFASASSTPLLSPEDAVEDAIEV
jgi:AraC-like DNA-binding protein